MKTFTFEGTRTNVEKGVKSIVPEPGTHVVGCAFTDQDGTGNDCHAVVLIGTDAEEKQSCES